MKAVVVYESMYGNTHLLADAIGDGLREHADVTVVSVEHANAELLVTRTSSSAARRTHTR